MRTIEIYADTRGKSQCRSCSARIEWAEVVASGKRMPFDDEIVAVSSRLDTAHRLIETVDLEVTTSHFATCPDAQKWRKAR